MQKYNWDTSAYYYSETNKFKYILRVEKHKSFKKDYYCWNKKSYIISVHKKDINSAEPVS